VPAGLELRADRLRLEQALGNLLANAVAHGEEPVRLRAEARDGSIELHVEDSGQGLPADFAGRAFERFSRADSARTGAGAGLGLAIVDAVARAHGGSAGASGADFWISLPRTTTSSHNHGE
jgi:signal transduction histidine kinase